MINTENFFDERKRLQAFVKRAETEEARSAIEIALELADMICFHARCRANGEAMMVPWDD